MPNSNPKPVLTTETLVHGMFLQVDQIRRYGHNLQLRCHPTSDPDVRSVTVNVSQQRAEELGLVD